MTPVRLEPAAPRSRVKHSTTEPLCSHPDYSNDALWSPAGKGLASWLSFIMSNCEVATFPLVSWLRCDILIVLIHDLCPLSYLR